MYLPQNPESYRTALRIFLFTAGCPCGMFSTLAWPYYATHAGLTGNIPHYCQGVALFFYIPAFQALA